MSGVAVLVACVGDGKPVETARVEQVRRLWRRLGLAVDLVLVTSGRSASMPPIDVARFRQFGCLPDHVLAAGGDCLDRFLVGMNLGAPYTAAHLVDLEERPSPRAAGVLISEGSGAALAVRGDLVLTRTEDHRAALAGAGCRAVRLPLDGVPPGPAIHGRAVGWIGDWSPGRVRSWGEALHRLSRLGMDLSGGIVLCGPGAAAIAIPDNLARVVCKGPGKGHLSVLGLLVAPDPPLGSDAAVVSGALALGLPVLLGPQGAGAYEDRWHLPVIGSADGLCDLIAAWSADPQVFRGAVIETRRAFERDLAAMTDHVLDEVEALLTTSVTGGPHPRRATTPIRSR